MDTIVLTVSTSKSSVLLIDTLGEYTLYTDTGMTSCDLPSVRIHRCTEYRIIMSVFMHQCWIQIHAYSVATIAVCVV